MPIPDETFKVFLSHSEKDKDLVQRISELLTRLHVRPWIYEYFYVGGSNRFERIKTNIEDSPYFLALLTADGLSSQWVNQEIGYAVGIGKDVIPILEVDPSSGERLKSRGFVELNDPILLNPQSPSNAMKQLVYTFYSLLSDDWLDMVWLTCKCGNEWDGVLKYYENIFSQPDNKQLVWTCKRCGKKLSIGLPGFDFRFLAPENPFQISPIGQGLNSLNTPWWLKPPGKA